MQTSNTGQKKFDVTSSTQLLADAAASKVSGENQEIQRWDIGRSGIEKVKHGDNWFAAIGMQKITPDFENEEGIDNYLADMSYDLLITIIATMAQVITDYKLIQTRKEIIEEIKGQ